MTGPKAEMAPETLKPTDRSSLNIGIDIKVDKIKLIIPIPFIPTPDKAIAVIAYLERAIIIKLSKYRIK